MPKALISPPAVAFHPDPPCSNGSSPCQLCTRAAGSDHMIPATVMEENQNVIISSAYALCLCGFLSLSPSSFSHFLILSLPPLSLSLTHTHTHTHTQNQKAKISSIYPLSLCGFLSLSSPSSMFQSHLSGVHHFGWDFCVCERFLNPTIEVVTFHFHGWLMLGVFLLPAFTRLGHECEDLLSLCDGMHVCTH